jgi:hypothetical protein
MKTKLTPAQLHLLGSIARERTRIPTKLTPQMKNLLLRFFVTVQYDPSMGVDSLVLSPIGWRVMREYDDYLLRRKRP